MRDNWLSNCVFKSFTSMEEGTLLPEDEQWERFRMIIEIADDVCGMMTPYRSAVSYDVRISRLRNAVTNIPRTAA
jgi:hypothetical protein